MRLLTAPPFRFWEGAGPTVLAGKSGRFVASEWPSEGKAKGLGNQRPAWRHIFGLSTNEVNFNPDDFKSVDIFSWLRTG